MYVIRGWEFKKVTDFKKIISAGFGSGRLLSIAVGFRPHGEKGPHLKKTISGSFNNLLAALINAEATLLSEAGLAFRQRQRLASGAKLFPKAEANQKARLSY